MAGADLTAQRLRELLNYDPETGAFTWLPRPERLFRTNGAYRSWNSHYANKSAGSQRHDLYWEMRVFGKRYRAHRLAWLYMTGEMPTHEIDHRDGDPSNNRIDNLRDVSTSVNMQNQRKATSRNKSSGMLGVTKGDGNRWKAAIVICGKRRHLGCFDTPAAAHAAYLTAKRIAHPGCLI